MELIAAAPTVDLNSSGRFLLGVALGIYAIVLLALSLVATRQVKTEEDFLVAGRRLPLFLAWGSLIATWFGAATMTGAARAARESGLVGVAVDPIACSATLILAGVCFAAPLWRMKLLTTADFFRRCYGTRAELVACSLQVPSYFGWIAAQYLALGEVLQVYFGMDLATGILCACAFTLIYTLVGGMWSVSLTDTVQIVVAFLGLLILGYNVFAVVGGGSMTTGIDRFLVETDPEFFRWIPTASVGAILSWSAAWAAGLFGNIPGQDLQQRIFAAKDAWTARWACILAGVLYFAFGMIPVSMGLLSRITDPTADSAGILQILAGKYLSPTLAIVFVISFVSIVVSTACSAVLAPSTLVGHNLLGRFQLLKGRHLLLERLCVVAVSLCGLIMTAMDKSILELVQLALSIQLVALFVPMVAGLYGRPRSEYSAIFAQILGFAAFLVRFLAEEWWYRVPDELRAQGVTLIQHAMNQSSPEWAGVVKDLLTVPPALYGLAASITGYFLAQRIWWSSAPINDQVLADAWTIREDRDR